MTAGEVKSMPDDTELIIFANKPHIKAKKAYQFELFPDPFEMLNQNKYVNRPNPQQIDRLEKEIEEFEASAEQRQQEIKKDKMN